MPDLPDNATLVERIQYYVEYDELGKAKILATLGDFLEECYEWDISFAN